MNMGSNSSFFWSININQNRLFLPNKLHHHEGLVLKLCCSVDDWYGRDIYKNPGPTKIKTLKHPCNECKKIVCTNQKALMCAKC